MNKPIAPNLGRPSIFSQEIVDEICRRLAGGKSLRKICLDNHMPSTTTVKNWLRDTEKADFLAQYVRAREDQADFYADEIIDISDESGFDARIVEGKIIVDGDAIARARLRVDSRKWYAGKVAPKKYGDKITNELTGPNGGAIPISFDVSALSDATMAELLLAKQKTHGSGG